MDAASTLPARLAAPTPATPPHSHLLAHAAERLWSLQRRESDADVGAAIETAYDRAVDAIAGGCSDADVYEAFEAARAAQLEYAATYLIGSWGLVEVEERLESLEGQDDLGERGAGRLPRRGEGVVIDAILIALVGWMRRRGL